MPLARSTPRIDPVGVSWLVTVRWTTLVAGIGAIVAGRSGLQAAVPLTPAIAVLSVSALTNIWLIWRTRVGQTASTMTAAGVLICMDVVVISWLLSRTGGVLNPASVYYLVQIVLAALVLGRTWTWIVTSLSVAGYGALFLGVSTELEAAQVMHPEIGLHMRGMWLAFAVSALIIAVLMTRLLIAIERRDVALAALRDRTARASRFAGLTTLATGAAHELSTPLATMAIAARELEHSLEQRPADAALYRDAQLIRAEIDRCRRLLEGLAGRAGGPIGEAPTTVSLADAMTAVIAGLRPSEQRRVRLHVRATTTVVWPIGVVATAVANLVRNALQASADTGDVDVDVASEGDARIRIATVDRGVGMSDADLARAGEPFFTTKPPGDGTGLGLFVARSAVEQLGGQLTIASSLGQGTTATIVLPADVVAADGHTS